MKNMKKIFTLSFIFLLLLSLSYATSLPQEHALGEILVKLKNNQDKTGFNSAGVVETGIVSVDVLNSKYKTTSMKKLLEYKNIDKKTETSFKKHGLDRIFLLKIAKNADVTQAVREFNNNPNIEYAEPNYIVHTTLTPNDPDFSKLYGLHNTGQTGGTIDADIDAPESWDLQTGNSGVLIAVIDTGVDYNHADLSANMWTNPGEVPNNGIDDDANGFIDDIKGWDFYNNDNDPFDDYGHGTHVAGTIGGVGNNGIGVAGVNWNVKIMPIKFLGASGSGTIDNAVKSVQYATLMGVHVMSNSWGGGGFSQALKDAISAANDVEILFVAAAGNNNNNNDAVPFYPASYDVPNVVTVATTDHNDLKASFSSYGANSVHLGAPGVNIYSTVPTGACSLCNPTGYTYLSGTSMATPHVSGVAGLIKSQFPALTSDGIKARLLGGVDKIASLDGITITGGRLNSINTLETDTAPPSAVTDLKATNAGSNSVTLTWTATGDDGSVGTASSYDIRYSTSPITETNWNNAIKAVGEPKPKPAGSADTFTVKGLSYSTAYYFAMKVVDNFGNPSALSNIASATTTTPTIIFEDNMENGLNGWTANSLWHQETKRAYSPLISWAYNTGSPNYDYNIGTNSGSLTSPTIDLSAYNSATLTFKYLYQTEAGTYYDQRWIQIGANGNFTNIKQLSADPLLVWSNNSLDLSSYAGKPNVQVRFFFNTVDGMFNNYEGWYIDDVIILGEPLKSNNAPVANANGPYAGTEDTTITFDGSGSYDLDNDPLTYRWDFGDGATGTGVNPSHAYKAGGVYTVTLIVNDGKIDSTPSTTIVNISKENIPPTVYITSPVDGSYATGVISVNAIASDNKGVTKVEFYLDSYATPFDTVTASPYNTLLNTTKLIDGSHTLKAKAYDAAGNSAVSSPVSIISDNTAPTVSITRPVDGSTVKKRTDVTIAAAASDSISGVNHVDFFVNGVLKCRDGTSPYTCIWSVPSASHVVYKIQSSAYNNVGLNSSSLVVTIKSK